MGLKRQLKTWINARLCDLKRYSIGTHFHAADGKLDQCGQHGWSNVSRVVGRQLCPCDGIEPQAFFINFVIPAHDLFMNVIAVRLRRDPICGLLCSRQGLQSNESRDIPKDRMHRVTYPFRKVFPP